MNDKENPNDSNEEQYEMFGDMIIARSHEEAERISRKLREGADKFQAQIARQLAERKAKEEEAKGLKDQSSEENEVDKEA